MGLLDLHRFSTAGTLSRNLGYADQGFGPSRAGPDDQLIADCHSLMCQIGTLLNEIEQAAEAKGPEQGRRQASLCEADDQAFDLMERIADTRAVSPCGVQSKHAAAVFLLSIDWHDDPSPCRDKLLLSFVLDAVRHSYPTIPNNRASLSEDTDTTTTVIVRANTCLAVIKELAADFAQKDQEAKEGPVNQDLLDVVILALREQKKTAVEALVGVQAFSMRAIHAKRVVLRRMLEAGMYDGDAHHLRVELARSYFRDLKTFLQTNAREGHGTLSGHHTIWDSLSSSFRWLTSTVHLR